MSKQDWPGIDRYLIRFIKAKVKAVIGKYGFTAQDRVDLEHDLLLHALSRQPRFDPTRSAKATFYAKVVTNRLRNIIEAREAALRCIPPGFALNEEVEDDDGLPIERLDLLGEDEYLLASGRIDRLAIDARDLEIDLRRSILALPPELQRVCLLLLTRTITQIARDLDLTPPSIYARIRMIRRQFEARGLGRYL